MEKEMLAAVTGMMVGDEPQNILDNVEKISLSEVLNRKELPRKTNGIDAKILWEGIPDNLDWKETERLQDINNFKYTKAQYEKMGIKVVNDVADDDLFCEVILPEGWTTLRSNGYWTNVYDEKGRERISFFAKTFYDREAFSNFNRRYSFEACCSEEGLSYDESKLYPWEVWLTDCRKKVKLLEKCGPATTREDYFAMRNHLDVVAKNYLHVNFPDYQDCNSYWDEE